MTESELRVKDALSEAFILLNPLASVAEAIGQLQPNNAIYGIAPDHEAGLPVLVTAEHLSRAQDDQISLGDWIHTLPRATPVHQDAMLDQVTRVFVDHLVDDPDISGLIVWNDQQEVLGIVPRQALADVAEGLMERGGKIDQLEGEILLSVGVYYFCSVDNEQKRVTYYQPNNPPTCSNGHLMKRKP